MGSDLSNKLLGGGLKLHLLLLLIIFSGCTSIEKGFATLNLENVTIYAIRDISTDKYDSLYEHNEKRDSHFTLQAGAYILQIGCDKYFTGADGSDGHLWVFTDYAPEMEIEIDANQNYFISCNPTSEGQGVYIQIISP